MKRRNAVIIVLLAAALWSLGCGGEPAAEREDRRVDVDRLRSLPYAGSTRAMPGERDGVLVYDAERSSPGVNLYTVQALCRADLIDAEGHVLRTWSHDAEGSWERAELLPGGDLLVVGLEGVFAGAPAGRSGPTPDGARYLQRYDWNGNLLWERRLPVHHDVELAPDGTLLALAFLRRSVPDLIPEIPVRDDRILRLDTDGNVLEDYSLLDAIGRGRDRFPLGRVQPSPGPDGAPQLDLLHANSLEWVVQPGEFADAVSGEKGAILVCFRHQNRVAIFDWAARRAVWSWGKGELSGPHDAQLLPDGHVLIFDNGIRQQRSRLLEVDPATGGIVWEYQADPPGGFYTLSKGSIQRLPNGNTLAAESDSGRAFEVTPTGEVVWEFLCPHRVDDELRAAIVRMKRFPLSLIEAAGRRP